MVDVQKKTKLIADGIEIYEEDFQKLKDLADDSGKDLAIRFGKIMSMIEQIDGGLKEKEEKINTTISMSKEDKILFKEYARQNNIQLNDLFHYMITLLRRMTGSGNFVNPMMFYEYINNYCKKSKSKEMKRFQVMGRFCEQSYLYKGEINKENKQFYLSGEVRPVELYKIDQMEEWLKAIEKEFDLNDDYLDHDKEITCQLRLYNICGEDTKNKYMIQDSISIVEIQKNFMASKKVEKVSAVRYFFVNDSEELKERLERNLYLYLKMEDKQKLISAIENDKKIKLLKDIENECKELYLK